MREIPDKPSNRGAAHRLMHRFLGAPATMLLPVQDLAAILSESIRGPPTTHHQRNPNPFYQRVCITAHARSYKNRSQ